jgi:hypothetical protein
MTLLLTLLAVAGVVAILTGLIRALFRMVRGGVETFIAGEVANARAGRGDISALTAAEEWRASSRVARRWYAAQVLGWLILLIIPTFTPWTRELYAAACVLWLVPRRRQRPQVTSPRPQ